MKYRIVQWSTYDPPQIIGVFSYRWLAELYKWIYYDCFAEPAWKMNFEWEVEIDQQSN